jgi:hypothetical protein
MRAPAIFTTQAAMGADDDLFKQSEWLAFFSQG